MKNIDRIRAMTAEELAKIINRWGTADPADRICREMDPEQACRAEQEGACVACIKEWLEREEV